MPTEDYDCLACNHESSRESRAEHRIGSPPGPNPPGLCITYRSGPRRKDHIIPKEEVKHYLQGMKSPYCEGHLLQAIKRDLKVPDELELKLDSATETITIVADMHARASGASDTVLNFLEAVDQIATA